MSPNTQKNRASESGNVMVYLMIAVVLLAALSFAVAQGGRGGAEPLNAERLRLVSADIMAYGDTIEKAVAQLRLRGSEAAALRFAHSDLPAASYGTYGTVPFDEIFNPQGGAAIYARAVPQAMVNGTQEDYQFLANNEIEGIGTTCGDASCSDLLMVLENVRRDVCEQINKLAGVGAAGAPPPKDSDVREAEKFQGTFGYSETIGGEVDGAPIVGQAEGCFEETDDSQFVYYKVLIAR